MKEPTKSQERDEDEANYFAAHLLVPSNLLRQAISEMKNFNPVNDKMVNVLAKRFGVPVFIMIMRINEEYLM